MKHLLFFILLSFSYGASSQIPFREDIWHYAETIDAATLKKHVYILASDSLEGRESGKPGQYKAADYIAKNFARIGLQTTSVTNNQASYYQNFNLTKITWKPSYVIINKDTLTLFKDIYAKGELLLNEPITLQPLFLGYGIESENYSDYKNKNLTGKAVIILLGEPMIGEISVITGTTNLSEWSESWQKKAALAYSRGAKVVIFANPLSNKIFSAGIKRMRETKNGFSLGAEIDLAKDKALFVTENHACKILDIDSTALAKWKQQARTKNTSISAHKKALHIFIHATLEKTPTQNVIGLLEGTEIKDEYLVISAHYDHLGKRADGSIFYGADDDGSGTAAVLCMAEAFAKAKTEGNGPRRSILFVAFTGEEMGLLGSSHYTSFPLFPLANTIANLNIDMIGRVDKKNATDSNYVYLIGSDKLSQELHSISEQTNHKFTHLTLDYTYNDPADPEQLYYRSDHYNFAKNGIPVIFYFTGLHEDYHKITDTPDKLLYIKTSTISKLVFMTAYELANKEERLQVDRK